MAWISIGEERARAHPLHGMNGPLFGFYLLALGGLLVRLMGMSAAMRLAHTLDPTLSDVCMILLALSLALPLPFLMLALSEHPATPAASILCIWLAAGLDAAFLFMGVMIRPTFLVAAASAAAAPLFTLYMLRSRRVNVTYRHRVRPGDPILAAAQAP